MTGYPLWRQPGSRRPTELAAQWALLHEKGELHEANKRRFADWLAEDASHFAAYEDALWALDAVSRHAGEPEILALRNAALEARGNRGRIWAWTGGAGLAAAAVAGVISWSAGPYGNSHVGTPASVAAGPADPKETVHRTGIGEQSAVPLPDGSVAMLDTDSELRVTYSRTERAVHLLKGQALFQVAPDKHVPFQVYAKSQRITAVGTVFNVRIEGEEVRISMVEGTVKVRPLAARGESPSAAPKEVVLTAGETVVAKPAKPPVVRAVDPRQVASWKGGMLVFNDTPLSDAVAEINRYNTRPIAIADASVGAYRVSGVFKSNDPEHFSRAMAEVFPIEVTRSPDGSPTLRARAD